MGQQRDGFPCFVAAGNNFIINIRDVAGIHHGGFPVTLAQQAKQGIKNNRRAGIADMGVIINRGAAHIQGDSRGVLRFKSNNLPPR